MSAEAGPISLLARDCRELFMKWEKRLEEESRFTELDFVADYYDRFEAWAAFLGVFSGPLASLDHRLRRHPSIQDMVMRLLDILRHNLFDGEVYLSSQWSVSEFLQGEQFMMQKRFHYKYASHRPAHQVAYRSWTWQVLTVPS